MNRRMASRCAPFFGIRSKRNRSDDGVMRHTIHHRMMRLFSVGISSSSLSVRSGQGKSVSRCMNGVAVRATRKFACLQQASTAARPLVKLSPTGTLSAKALARLASMAPLLAGNTIAIRGSLGNSFRRRRLSAAAAPSSFAPVRLLSSIPSTTRLVKGFLFNPRTASAPR